MRANSVESMDAIKERLHDFHSAIAGGGSGGQTPLYSPGRSRAATEMTQNAPFHSPSSSSSSNQPVVDNNATSSGGADGGDDEQKKASEDMIKRLQSHHAAIIQAQAKKSREKKAKAKEEYDDKIHRIIESVHHAQQPQPQQSQPNQATPPPARLVPFPPSFMYTGDTHDTH